MHLVCVFQRLVIYLTIFLFLNRHKRKSDITPAGCLELDSKSYANGTREGRQPHATSAKLGPVCMRISASPVPKYQTTGSHSRAIFAFAGGQNSVLQEGHEDNFIVKQT